MDAGYVCTLSEACLKQAKKELNEDPKDRISSVKKLREWIEMQPHLKCRTDTTFLLKFLRTAKFSQLRAREIIEGYLTLRHDLPQWYTNLDPREAKKERFFKAGILLPLPGYLKNGTKLVLYRMHQLDEAISKAVKTDIRDAFCRYWFMMGIYLLMDENIQVSGIVYLIDYSNFPMKAMKLFSVSELKDSMRFQGNTAGRYKGFWGFNESTVVDVFIGLFTPFMKKKMVERLRFFGRNLEELYKEVPKSMLPVEYLPDDYDGPNAGTLQTLTDEVYKGITKEEVANELACESDAKKWGIDPSQKPDIAPASFRKLTID